MPTDPPFHNQAIPDPFAASRPPAKKRDTATNVPFIPIFLAFLVATIAGLWPSAPALRHAGMHDPPAADPAAHLPPLNSSAPDFSLHDAHDPATLVTLSQLTAKAPVLLIFYQGYSCSRCVLNLHDIADRKDQFDKAGLQILAISADSTAGTRDSVNLYGDFPFPLLSDPDSQTARAYGLLDPAGDKLHAAFVIDKHNRLRLASAAEHPYDDLDALLTLGHQLQQEK